MLVYMYNNDKNFIGSRMAQIDPVQTKKTRQKNLYYACKCNNNSTTGK